MRAFRPAVWLLAAGCVGGLTPLNLDGGTDLPDTSTDGGGGGGGGGGGTDTTDDTTPGGGGGGGGGGGTTPGDCDYPDVDVMESGPVAGVIQPSYISVDLFGLVYGEDVYDLNSPFVEADSGDGDIPAHVVFTFYDASVAAICIIFYDAVLDDVSAATWDAAGEGGEVYQAWRLELAAGTGDAGLCGTVNAAAWGGSADLRDWIEERIWGIGVGELAALEADIRTAVTMGGDDWATEWEPYVMGSYLSAGSLVYEVGYAFTHAQECGVIEEDASGFFTPLPGASGGPVAGFVITTSFLVLDPRQF